MLHHLEHHGDDDPYSAAFCCLYCAERHMTRSGLEEHAKVHSTEMNVQESSEVCIGTHHAQSPHSAGNHFDNARRRGHIITQDLRSGATLPIYKGGVLGEIYRPSALTDSAVLLLIFSGYQLPHHGGIILLSSAWVCHECQNFGSNNYSELATHLKAFVFLKHITRRSLTVKKRSPLF